MLTSNNKFVVLLALLLLLATPSSSRAQSSNNWSNEGQSEWQGMDTEHIRGWRRYSSELRQAIDALPNEVVRELQIPVQGVSVSSLTSNFGDPRDGGARTHTGLDIMAPRGTPVISPTEAVVIRTGEGSNSGIHIYTANPGGESFVYMHLNSIASGIETGKKLFAGEVIGFVGNTGNASGGPPHLHFEIRKDGPIDPYPRLTKMSPSTEGPTGSTLTSIPKLDLDIGSTGERVITLQKTLIAEDTGPAAKGLAEAGATGYFGTITQNALKEFQLANGITPATGYYGPVTRAYISNLSSRTVATATFSRDLSIGAEGEDVRLLQKYLNENGYPIAKTGPGSLDNETLFFGKMTETALILFQKDHNISPARGYFGPITLAYIKSN